MEYYASYERSLPQLRYGVSHPTFVYSPLSAQQGSIRVLQVLPDKTTDGLLHCRLLNSSMRGSYTCLSYVWGSSKDPQDIYVSSERTVYRGPHKSTERFSGITSVRRNLWNFLNVARTKYPEKLLWIDAICINQADIEERNSQVQQMGDIYDSRELLCWFGAEPELTWYFAVLSLVKNMTGDEQRKMLQGAHRDRTAFLTLPHIASSYAALCQKLGIEEDGRFWNRNDNLRHGEMAFMFNDYWPRAWITQELRLTSRGILVAGLMDINLSTIIQIYRLDQSVGGAFEPQEQGREFITYYQSWWDISCDIPARAAFRVPKTMMQFLFDHSHPNLECAVKSDRINSLLSLCTPQEREDLSVNYALTDDQLLVRTIEATCLPCFCSVSIVANTLDMEWPEDQSPMFEHGLEFELTPQPYTDQCRACDNKSLFWDNLFDPYSPMDMFCFHDICEHIKIHVLWDSERNIFKATSHKSFLKPQLTGKGGDFGVSVSKAHDKNHIV